MSRYEVALQLDDPDQIAVVALASALAEAELVKALRRVLRTGPEGVPRFTSKATLLAALDSLRDGRVRTMFGAGRTAYEHLGSEARHVNRAASPLG